jgi:hypothetical protein
MLRGCLFECKQDARHIVRGKQLGLSGACGDVGTAVGVEGVGTQPVGEETSLDVEALGDSV